MQIIMGILTLLPLSDCRWAKVSWARLKARRSRWALEGCNGCKAPNPLAQSSRRMRLCHFVLECDSQTVMLRHGRNQGYLQQRDWLTTTQTSVLSHWEKCYTWALTRSSFKNMTPFLHINQVFSLISSSLFMELAGPSHSSGFSPKGSSLDHWWHPLWLLFILVIFILLICCNHLKVRVPQSEKLGTVLA